MLVPPSSAEAAVGFRKLASLAAPLALLMVLDVMLVLRNHDAPTPSTSTASPVP